MLVPMPNAEIVAQYLYLFPAIYLVTQNIRNILQLPQRSYEKFLSEDPILFCMKKTLLQPDFFLNCVLVNISYIYKVIKTF